MLLKTLPANEIVRNKQLEKGTIDQVSKDIKLNIFFISLINQI